MTKPSQLKVASFAVALYTGWNAQSLIAAWQHSPFDRADVLAWLTWMVPVVLGLFGTTEPRMVWLGAALVLTFSGLLLDLNLLSHLALAAACAGLTAPRRSFWVWLPMALTWMPLFGYFFSKYGLGIVAIGSLRVLFAAAGTLGYYWIKR